VLALAVDLTGRPQDFTRELRIEGESSRFAGR
jgi:hypothetical protein